MPIENSVRRATSVWGIALATATAVTVYSGHPAAAADTPGAMRGALVADAGEALSFDIRAQDLSEALKAFARLTGWQLSFPSDLTKGLSGNPVRGRLSPTAALDALLSGTGLYWQKTGERTVVLTANEATGDAIVLQPVTVEGEGENAWGPVTGFVASGSAVGTKTDTPLIETPQSISVVTRDQMDAQNAQTVPQALRYSPGVQADRNGADQRSDYLFSRGFSLNQYVDGTRSLSGVWTLPQVEAYGVERVDILKGPASVLYGQSSPGGLAVMRTKRALAEERKEVEVQTGTFERKQFAFDVTGPVDDEKKFLYRVTGLLRDTDTQVEQTKEKRLYLAPTITWRPNDATKLNVNASITLDPESGPYYKLPSKGTALYNPNGAIPTDFYSGDPDFDQNERKQYVLGYEFEHEMNDAVTLRQNARYTRIDGDYRILTVNSLAADQHTLNRSAYAADETTDTFAIDNQAQLKTETGAIEHTLIGGADIQYLTSDRVDSYGTAPTISYLNPVYGQAITNPPVFLDNEQTMYQLGGYLQDQMKYGAWSLVLGGRYDYAKTRTFDNLKNDAKSQSDGAFTGRAGLIHNFDSGFAPYVSYSESFEPTSGTDVFGKAFKPTTGQQVEVGIKFEPKGGNTMITLSAYDLTQQNVVTADTDAAHLAIDPNAKVQTGEIATRGIEFEAKTNPMAGLNVVAAYAYLDSEVAKSNDGYQGKVPVYQPEHTASIWGDYEIQGGQAKGVGFGVGVRYFGETFGDAANTFKVSDYTLVDAALRYDLGNLRPEMEGVTFALNANNLFDKVHVTECQNANTCYYGARRTVMATFKYRW